MKGLVKASTVDKYLRPIRLQIASLIQPNTSVVDFGCGNGELLFLLSSKIRKGLGLDKSTSLITYAGKRAERKNVGNLAFRNIDLTKESINKTKVDYAIASLLLHVLDQEKALKLLKQLIDKANTTIICGFSQPENAWQEFLLWLDQRFNSHYPHYKQFKKNGYTEGLLRSLDNIEFTKIETFDPVIKIYKVVQHKTFDIKERSPNWNTI